MTLARSDAKYVRTKPPSPQFAHQPRRAVSDGRDRVDRGCPRDHATDVLVVGRIVPHSGKQCRSPSNPIEKTLLPICLRRESSWSSQGLARNVQDAATHTEWPLGVISVDRDRPAPCPVLLRSLPNVRALFGAFPASAAVNQVGTLSLQVPSLSTTPASIAAANM